MKSKNSLKSRTQSGENLYGFFIIIPSPSIVEMVGFAGFDFVILDREHGGADIECLENLIRAAEVSGLQSIVRVPNCGASEIQWALDAGATGILVPHVKNAEDARNVVRAAHYPPTGTRGLATTTKAGHHGFVDVAGHLRRAAEETFVMVQIEDAEAVPHAAAIAQTPGVDSVFIGPADLSISLGHPGNPDHPVVVAAINDIVKAVADVGRPGLSMLARSSADAKAREDLGIKTLVFSSSGIIAGAFRELAREIAGNE